MNKKYIFIGIFMLFVPFLVFGIEDGVLKNTKTPCVGGGCVFELQNSSNQIFNWERKESGFDQASNFVNNNKPIFNLKNGVFEFNAGQVKQGVPYRGYYVAKVNIDYDFLLTYNIKLDTANIDSNAVMVYLSDSNPEGFYDFAKSKDKSFYTWISSGRSSWSSLNNDGTSGQGFQLIGSRISGVERKQYLDAYDFYLGANMYGFKYSPQNEYIVKMYRKGGYFGFSIEPEQGFGKIQHYWKAKDINNTKFKYLVLGISNSDDNDSFGSAGPVGKIWNIKLDTNEPFVSNGINNAKIEEILKENKTTTSTNKVGIKNTINKKIKPGLIKDSINNVNTKSKPKFIKDPNSKTVYIVDESNNIKPILDESVFRELANIAKNTKIDWKNLVENPKLKEFKLYKKN